MILAERVEDTSRTYQTLGKVPKNVHADSVSALESSVFECIAGGETTRTAGVQHEKIATEALPKSTHGRAGALPAPLVYLAPGVERRVEYCRVDEIYRVVFVKNLLRV